MPSDTFFARSPDWAWFIILYFFLGGIAGGAYFVAGLVELLGNDADRRLVRVGYFVAFPLVVISGLLLTMDLTHPERFWHMLIASKVGLLMFKYWSPMSVGSWALLIFGLFTFVSFVGALVETGVLPVPALVRLDRVVRASPIGALFTLVGSLFGFFVASYTGVLLSVTNGRYWADTNLLGALFLCSGASTAIATIVLLGRRGHLESAHRLLRMERWIMILELLLLIGLVGGMLLYPAPFAALWLRQNGFWLIGGVAVLGILAPMFLHLRPRALGAGSLPVAAVLALVGGFILRYAVVMSAQVGV